MQTNVEATNSAKPASAPGLGALARAATTRGTAVYLKTVLPTRCLPMPVSRDVDEYLYVVHGELDVWVDDRHTALRAGTSIELPRRRTRKVANFSGRPAKVLIVTSPPKSVNVYRRVPTQADAGTADNVCAIVSPGSVRVAVG